MFETLTTGIGIDISEHHIRFAHVGFLGHVKDLGEIKLPDGLIVDERVVDLEKVITIVREHMQQLGTRGRNIRATLLLPESRVFSTSFITPKQLKGKELLLESQKIAQSEIPIPFSSADISVSRGGKEEGGVRTTLYAVDSRISKDFQAIVTATPFRLIAVEANTKAVLRLVSKQVSSSYLPKSPKELVAIIDVGHSWASISVYTLLGSSMYSRSISYEHIGRGGVQNGVLSTQIVDSIIGTMNEIMVYFDKHDRRIVSVFMSGFEALDSLFESRLKQGVKQEFIAKTLAQAISLSHLDAAQIHRFGAAIGAAMRAVHPHQYRYQHNLVKQSSKKV